MPSDNQLSAAKPAFVIFVALLLACAIVPAQAQAQKFKVLHTFHGKDGAFPVGQLVRDADGNLYGTTGNGGVSTCFGTGCGTVFKMDRSGKLIWSYSFDGEDGFSPTSGVIRDAKGNLYGTTQWGGTPDCPDQGNFGCGVVFKLNPARKETVFHKFAGNCNGNRDGLLPEAVPAMDAAGNLYGTTIWGGPPFHCNGIVFTVDTAGQETRLYTFKGMPDGAAPGGLIRRGAQSFYGTTASGGSYNQGTMFRISAKGKESVLYSFMAGTGPPGPVLASDNAGNLYGTTDQGGGPYCVAGGCGTVFELSPSGNGWTQKTLYVFCQLPHCADGWTPLNGPLILDHAGNIYGTTAEGGTDYSCNSSNTGCGTVFKLDTSGQETVLHSFTGGADGWDPGSGLTMDDNGNLYGTTQVGGDRNCVVGNPDGCGVVFELTP